MNREKVFDAFRNCITEPKCKDCPWEQCEQFNQKKVSIPLTLALDVLNLLKEQEGKQLRCKTCTMRDKTGFCHRWNIEVKDDDYCSFGAWKGCYIYGKDVIYDE